MNMKKHIQEIIDHLKEEKEIEFKKEVKTKEEYVIVKANKGTVTHLASITNLVNNKYYIGCGSFSTNRMREVIVMPMELKAENIGCKKCREKYEKEMI